MAESPSIIPAVAARGHGDGHGGQVVHGRPLFRPTAARANAGEAAVHPVTTAITGLPRAHPAMQAGQVVDCFPSSVPPGPDSRPLRPMGTLLTAGQLARPQRDKDRHRLTAADHTPAPSLAHPAANRHDGGGDRAPWATPHPRSRLPLLNAATARIQPSRQSGNGSDRPPDESQPLALPAEASAAENDAMQPSTVTRADGPDAQRLSSDASPPLDTEALMEKLWPMIESHLAIERERQGWTQWR